MLRAVFVVVLLFLAVPCNAQTDERTAMPSTGRLLWGSKMTFDNQPCCTAPQDVPSADKSEAAIFAAAPGRAFREGPILKLKLEQNRTLKITDCDDRDACEADRFRTHRLAAWWPTLHYYVVNVSLWESGMAYLISERDGRTTRTSAVPILSPDKRFAVASDPSVNTGGGVTELLDMRVSPPVPFAPAAKCLQDIGLITVGTELKWTDNSHVVFSNAQLTSNRRRSFTLKIADDNNHKAEWECGS
jgi:hypothetical protein